MTVLILGCGDTGMALAALLAAEGITCVGVRRTPQPTAHLRMIAGDAADPALQRRLRDELPDVTAVVLAATPGLRRGRDHRLLEAAHLTASTWADTRLIYTSSTSVYGEAGGRTIDEDGPLAADDASQRLLAVEAAVRGHPRAVILRVAAIVGPGRTFARDRVAAGGVITVKGDPLRPFSFIHEHDLATVLRAAVSGRIAPGTWNACAPSALRVADYYHALAGSLGVDITVVGDGTAVPSRALDGSRLAAVIRMDRWRAPTEA